LFGASADEIVNVLQFKNDDFAGRDMNFRQLGRWVVERSHAVDPGVRVSAVEAWKAEHLRKDIVEGIPIGDAPSVHLHEFYDIAPYFALLDGMYGDISRKLRSQAPTIAPFRSPSFSYSSMDRPQ